MHCHLINTISKISFICLIFLILHIGSSSPFNCFLYKISILRDNITSHSTLHSNVTLTTSIRPFSLQTILSPSEYPCTLPPTKLSPNSYPFTLTPSLSPLHSYLSTLHIILGGVALRVFCPPGRANQGTFALDAGVRALDFYDDFFKVSKEKRRTEQNRTIWWKRRSESSERFILADGFTFDWCIDVFPDTVRDHLTDWLTDWVGDDHRNEYKLLITCTALQCSAV